MVKSYFQGPLIPWQSTAWWQTWPQFPDKATDKGRQVQAAEVGLEHAERVRVGEKVWPRNPQDDTAQTQVPLAQPTAPA